MSGVVFNWRLSPFIRTAYSYPSTSEKPHSRRDLARSEYGGKLVFAGEATDHDHAYMTLHSALRTGHRAAGEVQSLLRRTPPLASIARQNDS